MSVQMLSWKERHGNEYPAVWDERFLAFGCRALIFRPRREAAACNDGRYGVGQ